MHIQLQCSTGAFDASFVTRLRQFEATMKANGLDPSVYVISKDRPQFTSLPFFVRPGGDGYNYTVFVNGESFTVTKANDIAFLGYFEQLCAGAIYGPALARAEARTFWGKAVASLMRLRRWFEAPMVGQTKRSKRK